MKTQLIAAALLSAACAASARRSEPTAKLVPTFVVSAFAIETPTPRLPPSAMQSGKPGQALHGAYKLQIERDGSVSSVTSIQAVPHFDDTIRAQLANWRFRPLDAPVTAIWHFNFPTSPPKASAPARRMR